YTLSGNTLDHDKANQTGGADQRQDDFAVRVTDSDGDMTSGSAKIEVLINDDGPRAVDDSVTQAAADEGKAVEVDVKANDEHANGQVGADGVDWSAVTHTVAQNGGKAAGGTLSYNGDGTFTYTPSAGEEGTVTFDYTIKDGDGDTSTATVTIELAKDSKPEV